MLTIYGLGLNEKPDVTSERVIVDASMVGTDHAVQ